MSKAVVFNDDFNESDIYVGDILWYINDDINNGDPHPHVVVAINEGWIFTVCGTSQQETIERKIKNRCLPDNSWFPVIRPNNNSLTKDTFFDCCNYFEIHQNDLQDKFQKGETVRKNGKATYGEYYQIREALKSNPVIDIIDLLIHPEDKLN